MSEIIESKDTVIWMLDYLLSKVVGKAGMDDEVTSVNLRLAKEHLHTGFTLLAQEFGYTPTPHHVLLDRQFKIDSYLISINLENEDYYNG